jgi:hypothetical protein
LIGVKTKNVKLFMQLKTKPVWEMTEEEFEILVTPAVDVARQGAFAKGLPVSYHDTVFCQTENQFIHEYEDGRKFLVELNLNTREYTTIRELGG